MNEAQLHAIIDAAVQKAVADTKAAFAPMIAAADATNKGLLSDLKKQQGKPEPETPSKPRTFSEIMADHEKMMAKWEAEQAQIAAAKTAKAAPAKPAIAGVTPDGAFVLDREAARNPSVYRAARAAAEKAGKPLRIVDANVDSSPFVGPGEAPKKGDFVVGRNRYVHTSVVQGQLQQLHAETARDGKRLISFRHPDHLPDNALAVYNAPDGAQ